MPSLQLCDLVAAKVGLAALSPDEDQLIDRMIAAGMRELNFNSVVPGDDLVDGPPAPADGPDVVDQIAALTKRP